MKRIWPAVLAAALLFLMPLTVSAHPGRTDGNGGHYNWSTGEYHYHHGYSAHQHYDIDHDGTIDCPYLFDDKTNRSSGGGGGSGTGSAASAKTYSDGYADGHADGYEDGKDDGYDIGKSDGYDSGYASGLKDAEKEKESAVREASEEAQTSAVIGTAIIGAPAVFIGSMFLFGGVMDKEREKYQKTIKSLNDDVAREKSRAVLLRAGKPDVADDIPADVVLLHYCVPIKGVASKERPYGGYTVYISPAGKRYHSRCGCSAASTPIHFFDKPAGLSPCSLCVKPGMYPDKTPDWYKQIETDAKDGKTSDSAKPPKPKTSTTVQDGTALKKNPADPKNLKAVSSSCFSHIGYEDCVLTLKFRRGSTYRYYNVPEYVYQELLSATSMGRYFQENISDIYPYL